jgi:hypothetical protein
MAGINGIESNAFGLVMTRSLVHQIEPFFCLLSGTAFSTLFDNETPNLAIIYHGLLSEEKSAMPGMFCGRILNFKVKSKLISLPVWVGFGWRW